MESLESISVKPEMTWKSFVTGYLRFLEDLPESVNIESEVILVLRLRAVNKWATILIYSSPFFRRKIVSKYMQIVPLIFCDQCNLRIISTITDFDYDEKRNYQKTNVLGMVKHEKACMNGVFNFEGHILIQIPLLHIFIKATLINWETEKRCSYTDVKKEYLVTNDFPSVWLEQMGDLRQLFKPILLCPLIVTYNVRADNFDFKDGQHFFLINVTITTCGSKKRKRLDLC